LLARDSALARGTKRAAGAGMRRRPVYDLDAASHVRPGGGDEKLGTDPLPRSCSVIAPPACRWLGWGR